MNVLLHVEIILKGLGAGPKDLIRLAICFVGDAGVEKLTLQTIADRLAVAPDTENRPTVSAICLPELCYPRMCIELEGAACCSNDSNNSRESISIDCLPALHDGYAYLVRSGDLVFTNDMLAITSSGKIPMHGDCWRKRSLWWAS